MSAISVQVSLYPLRQPHLGPAISAVLEAFRARGLGVSPGTMSTVITGDADSVFIGLKQSFKSAAALGDVVMVVSISNCCPAAAGDPRDPQNIRS